MNKDIIQRNRVLTLSKALLIIMIIMVAVFYTIGILTGHSIVPY